MALRRRQAVAVLLFGSIAVSCTAGNAQSCPAFKEIHLPGHQPEGNRFATFPGGFVLLAAVLTTDTDGAPTAYHPDDIGSSPLCNGLDIFRDGKCVRDDAVCTIAVKKAQAVHWDPSLSPAFCPYGFVANSSHKVHDKPVWGAGRGDGLLPVQKEGDPAPGFFVSVTARPIRSTGAQKSQYADADRVPFLVMPPILVGAHGPTGYLNAGAIVRLSNNSKVYAIVADENESPAEISVAAAQLLREQSLKTSQPVTEAQLRGQGDPPWPYHRSNSGGRIKVSSSKDGPYVVFALSSSFGRAASYDPGKVEKLGESAFSHFGGVDNLAACAKQFFGL